MTSASSGNHHQIIQLCINPSGTGPSSVGASNGPNASTPSSAAAILTAGSAPQRLTLPNGLISSMTAGHATAVSTADSTAAISLGAKYPGGAKNINNVPQSPSSTSQAMNALLQASNIYSFMQQNGQLTQSNSLLPLITGTPSSTGMGSITTGNGKVTPSTTLVALPPPSTSGTTKINAQQQPPRILTPTAQSTTKSNIITLVPTNQTTVNGPNATTPTTTITLSTPSSPALVSSILKGGGSVNSNPKAANLVSSIINSGANHTQPIVASQSGSPFLSHNLHILPGLHPIQAQSQTIAQLSTNGILNQLQLKPTSSASVTNATSTSSSSNTRLISNMVVSSPSTNNLILTSQPIFTSQASQSVNGIPQTTTVNLISSSGPTNPSGQSSPASSPMKPNIIRKYNSNNRKESPAPSNSLSAMLNAANDQSNLRHPIYELTQEAQRQSSNPSGTINTAIPLSTLTHLPSTSILSTSSQASSSTASSAEPTFSSNNISQLIKSGLGNNKLNNAILGPSLQLVPGSGGQSLLIDPSGLSQSNQPIILPSTSTQPSTSIVVDQNHHSPVSSASSSNDTSRKRRKQDLKIQQQMIDNEISSLGNRLHDAKRVHESSKQLNQQHLNQDNQPASKIARLETSQTVHKLKSSHVDEDPIQIYSDNEEDYNDIDEVYDGADIDRDETDVREKEIEEEEEIEMLDDGSGYYLDDETLQTLSKEFNYVTEQGLKWSTKKRKFKIAMGDYYTNSKPNWSVKSNHFERYSDLKAASVKYKELNTTMLAATTCNRYQRELSSMFNGKILFKDLESSLNEWKFHYVISGIKNIACCENESLNEINQLFEFVQDNKMKFSLDWIIKINEAIKSNSQRHMYINEQLDESQQLLKRFFENKNSFIQSLVASSSSTSSSTSTSVNKSSERHEDMLSSGVHSSKMRNFNKPGGKKKLIKSGEPGSTVLNSNIGRSTNNSASTTK